MQPLQVAGFAMPYDACLVHLATLVGETRGRDLFAFRCLMRHSGMHDRVRCVQRCNLASCAHFDLVPTFLAVALAHSGLPSPKLSFVRNTD